jgi:hypothetical protein
MNKVQRKREREKRMVGEMIALYCRKQLLSTKIEKRRMEKQ